MSVRLVPRKKNTDWNVFFVEFNKKSNKHEWLCGILQVEPKEESAILFPHIYSFEFFCVQIEGTKQKAFLERYVHFFKSFSSSVFCLCYGFIPRKTCHTHTQTKQLVTKQNTSAIKVFLYLYCVSYDLCCTIGFTLIEPVIMALYSK